MIYSVDDVVGMKIPLGEIVTISGSPEAMGSSKGYDPIGQKKKKGRVVGNYPFFILVDTGKYAEAFNKADFITGKARINDKRKKVNEC